MSAISWFKGLSRGGKVAVGLVALGAVTAMAAPQQPVEPEKVETNVVSKSVVTAKQVTETEDIPFKETTKNDSSLPKGDTELDQVGVPGTKTLTYQVTLTDGKETSRKLIKEAVTTKPINQVTLVGTYVAPKPAPVQAANCDPNYAGVCVPIASDVDCGGGSGNGPEYVYSTVTVIGSDIYGLDGNGDGYGCE